MRGDKILIKENGGMHLADNVKYISFDEFVRNSGVSERTVRKRYREIPGIELTNSGEFRVLSGARYPFNMRNCKLEDSADRRYILLKAISQYKYISCTDIRVEQPQFKRMLYELSKAGLIQRNNLSNTYGANAYDCTIKGGELLQMAKINKKKAKEEMFILIAKVSGTFFSALVPEMCG